MNAACKEFGRHRSSNFAGKPIVSLRIPEKRTFVQQYWARLEEHQFVPVKAFAEAFKASKIGQDRAAEVEAPQEHVPGPGELDPLQRQKYAFC